MKRLIDVLLVLGVLALIAAGVVWWLLRDGSASVRDPAGRPAQEDPVSMISSKGVEKNISRRLTARSGREVDVVCPPKVNELVGTKFTCEASFAGDSEVSTLAKVKITGGGGAFTWTSAPAPTPEPSDDAG